MNIEEWWPKLTPETRDWLIANNGDALSDDVVAEITTVRGSLTSEPYWPETGESEGFYLTDEDTDWIEEKANEEPND